MNTELLSIAARLSDKNLLAQVKHLAGHEREATAGLIAHLAELDERRLYLGEGCSSLFTYCVEVLHLSEQATYARIQAARAARKFPVVLEKLATGALNLTTLGLLAPHLTAENHRELLGAAEHKSKRRVEELVAAVRPLPDVPASIRKQVSTRPAAPQSATLLAASVGGAILELPSTLPMVTPLLEISDAETRLAERTVAIPVPASQRPVIAPLTPERYRIEFTASAETREKLRRAQDLLRHQIPNGDPAAVIDRALTALIEQLAKTQLAAVARPRAARATRQGSRHIPAAVRRAAWKRDGGRCAFVSPDGRRCKEEGLLQFHHVKPHADDGEASIDNIELRCRAHNQYEADLYFGPGTSLIRKAAGQSSGFRVRESSAEYHVRTDMIGVHGIAGSVASGPGQSDANWARTQLAEPASWKANAIGARN